MIKGEKFFNLLIAALIIFFISPTLAKAQTGTWAVSFGSPFQDYAEDVLADAAGNVYVCGNFRDTIDFGGGNRLAAAGKTDVFLAKYDVNGQLAWAHRYGWFENEFSHSLKFDKHANVVMVGEYQDSTIFTNDTIFSLDTLWFGPYAQTYDVFILRVDPNGVQQDILADGWFGSEHAYDVEVDNDNFTVIAGMYRTFNQWAGVWGKGYDDIMLAIVDTNNVFLHGQVAGGAYIDRAQAVEIVGNSAYRVAGFFQDTCWFKDSTVYLVTDFEDDVFVANYDDTLALDWVTQAGGPGKDIMSGMVADVAGNVFVGGIFETSLTLDGNTISSAGELDGFLFKLDANGNRLWSRSIGGVGYDGVKDVALSPSGNLVVTGYFQREMTIDGTTLTAHDTLDQEMFMASFDASGALLWANLGGGSNPDIGVALSLDATGHAYVYGTFSGQAEFGQQTLVSAGSDDGFLLRVAPDGSVGTTPVAPNAPVSGLIAYPNPASGQVALRFELERSAKVQVDLLDMQGRRVRHLVGGKRLMPGQHTLNTDLQGLPAGMYFFHLQADGTSLTGKLTLTK